MQSVGHFFLEEAGKLIQHPCVKPVEHYPVMRITRGHGKIQHEVVPVQNTYRIRHLFVENPTGEGPGHRGAEDGGLRRCLPGFHHVFSENPGKSFRQSPEGGYLLTFSTIEGKRLVILPQHHGRPLPSRQNQRCRRNLPGFTLKTKGFSGKQRSSAMRSRIRQY